MPQKPNLKDINGLELDRRVWAYDEDRRIAEVALKGRLEGEWEWLEPKIGQVAWEAPLNLLDASMKSLVTQSFLGEQVEIIENNDAWSLIRGLEDRYLGWGFTGKINPNIEFNICSIHSLRGHVYTKSSVKSQTYDLKLSFGTHVSILETKGDWIKISIATQDEWGYIHKSALEPSNLPPLEWVKGFLGTPYLWGGRTAWGIDCSGLSQMYFRYQNIYVPRDADQQEEAFAKVENPRAGDLAFFDGHVGILLEQSESGNWRMLHANSRHMSVTVDTLGEGEYGQYLSSILHGYGRWDGEIGVYWKPK